MTDQSKIDWSLAPDDATHGAVAGEGRYCFYKFHENKTYSYTYLSGRHVGKNENINWNINNGDETTVRHSPLVIRTLVNSTFTKSDLKDGMRVTLDDGDEHYVCGNLWVENSESTTYVKNTEYNDDFTPVDDGFSKVVKVTDRDGTVLFERQLDAKEMTVADIERELGYSVKVVK